MARANRNPYEPSPAAITTSPHGTEPSEPAPRCVRVGVRLYLLSVVLYLISNLHLGAAPVTHTVVISTPATSAPAFDPSPQVFEWIASALLITLFVGVPGWLLIKIVKRRNWARIGLTVISGLTLSLVGFVFFGPFGVEDAGVTLGSVLVIGGATVEIVALVLLYLPRANEWFRVARSL